MYDDYLFYVVRKPFDRSIRPMAHWYFRKFALRADEIIGPSTKVVEFLHRCKVYKPVNIVPNTVDLSAFLSENNELEKVNNVKNILNIQDGDTCLCFVGRLGKEKSIDMLIRMFGENFENDPTKKLFLIGDGPERSSLEEEANKWNTNKNIQFLGRIEHEDLPPYYLAFNIFCTASLSEINSISMLEAIASGLFVVQKDDPLNENQISDGENGKLFQTSAEFGEIVKKYSSLTSPEKDTLKKSIVQTSKRYDIEEFAKKILTVYQSAIQKHKQK